MMALVIRVNGEQYPFPLFLVLLLIRTDSLRYVVESQGDFYSRISMGVN